MTVPGTPASLPPIAKTSFTPQTATSRQPAKTSPPTSIVSQPQIVSTVSLLLESPSQQLSCFFSLAVSFRL